MIAEGSKATKSKCTSQREPARGTLPGTWKPPESAWQHELLRRLPSIDPTQIEESLQQTPTERIERMRRFVEFLEDLRRAGWRPTSEG